MYKIITFLFFLGFILSTNAQIAIKVATARNKYLLYENINAIVTIRNYSGNTLNFGDKEKSYGLLHFVIFDGNGRLVKKHPNFTNPTYGLIIASGATKEVTLPLGNLYILQKDDDYSITAIIEHTRFMSKYQSSPAFFKVRSGRVVWDRKIGIPSNNTTIKIPARDVKLIIFHADTSDIYCLKIEDRKRVYSVVRLGPHIASVDPMAEVDGMSNIHTLLQLTPHLWRYQVLDFNGLTFMTKYYAMTKKTTPILIRDPDVGRITVYGGRKAIQGKDYFMRDITPRRKGWK